MTHCWMCGQPNIVVEQLLAGYVRHRCTDCGFCRVEVLARAWATGWRDAIRAIAARSAVLVVLAVAAWLDAQLPRPAGVLYADFGVSAIAAIIAALGWLRNIFGGKVSRELKRALEGLRDGIFEIGRELLSFIGATRAIFSRLVGLLRRFWSRVLVPLLRRLDQWADVVQKWLRSTFGPIIRALLWLRQKVLDFYERWLRPIFDTIDIIRRILSVLSLLQLDFARKLDRKLAELEDRLLTPIRLVVQKINEAIEILDRVVTLDGLFQRLTLLRSLVRDQRYTTNLWWNAQTAELTAAERAEMRASRTLQPTDIAFRELTALVNSGGSIHTRGIERFSRVVDSVAQTSFAVG